MWLTFNSSEIVPTEETSIYDHQPVISTTNYKKRKVTQEIPDSVANKTSFINSKSKSKPLPHVSKELGKPDCLAGLTFVFSGELSTMSRSDASDLVRKLGGKVTNGPSGKTSFVVIGKEPGLSKLNKIAQLKIKTMTETAFFEFIASCEK